jgi:hypothetical protein
MVDNSSLPVASGNETFANDDIGGIKYPRPKINWGPDGTANDVDVATGKPLPIQIRSATGLIPFGEPTDAKSVSTDTTSVSAVSIWKQISASVQSLVTSAVTVGTAGSPSTQVLSVQGVASGTAQPVSNTPLTNFGAGEYETVAASQTAQALGATGATGDYISGILVIPATTSPGLVTLLDNAISIPVFVGGATSVSNLVPFFIPLGMISVSGAWKITTGANVSCIGIGNFT